jgi:hypothetical protein
MGVLDMSFCHGDVITKKRKNKKKFIDFQKIERKRKHYTAVVNPVQL